MANIEEVIKMRRAPEWQAALREVAKAYGWDKLDTPDVLNLTVAAFEYYVSRLHDLKDAAQAIIDAGA